jgi:hypothetical protein
MHAFTHEIGAVKLHDLRGSLIHVIGSSLRTIETRYNTFGKLY